MWAVSDSEECGIRANTILDFWFLLFYFLFLNLVLAVLGLHCCAEAFSSSGEQGCSLAVMCGLLLLQRTGSRQAGSNSCSLQSLEHWLRSWGAQAIAVLLHVGFSWTGNWTYVPCTGILNQWTAREAHGFFNESLNETLKNQTLKTFSETKRYVLHNLNCLERGASTS